MTQPSPTPIDPQRTAVFPPPDSVITEELDGAFEHLKEAATELARAVCERSSKRLHHVACTHGAMQIATEHIEGALAALRMQAECAPAQNSHCGCQRMDSADTGAC